MHHIVIVSIIYQFVIWSTTLITIVTIKGAANSWWFCEYCSTCKLHLSRTFWNCLTLHL